MKFKKDVSMKRYNERYVAQGLKEIYGRNYFDSFHLHFVRHLFAHLFVIIAQQGQKCVELLSKIFFDF